MVAFSSLAKWTKQEVEAFFRRYPFLPHWVANWVFHDLLGFPYLIIPALFRFLLKLCRSWTLAWREIDRYGMALVNAFGYLALHILTSRMMMKKWVAKWAAVEFLIRSFIKQCPSETDTAHSWSMFVGRASEELRFPVYSFSTFAGFWSFYNHMSLPSQMVPGFDVFLLKDEWKEYVAADGRKLTLSFPRGNSDSHWQQTLKQLVREQFRCHRDDICGAVVSITADQEIISLWTKNAATEAAQLSIGNEWKGFLGCEGMEFTTQAAVQEDARHEEITTQAALQEDARQEEITTQVAVQEDARHEEIDAVN